MFDQERCRIWQARIRKIYTVAANAALITQIKFYPGSILDGFGINRFLG